MSLQKVLIILLGVIVSGGSGLFIYKLYGKQKNTELLLNQLMYQQDDKLKSTLGAPEQTSYDRPSESGESKISEKINPELTRRQQWSSLQQKFKDCVVQVFSQVAEFNWIEPYKAPTQYEAAGTAFFINPEGYLITNAHVVDQAKLLTIQIPSLGKNRYEVEVVGLSPERDLALIKLTSQALEKVKKGLNVQELPYLKLGDSDTILRADKIMAIGYPLGQQGLKSTTGVVSGREHILGQHYIQISAPINKGNSGGPSLNAEGQVIGVNSAGIREAQNVGYIIPSNDVKLFLQQLEAMPEDKKYDGVKLLRKPFLGVLFHSSNECLTQFLNNPMPGGPYVVEIYKESPLAKAGVKTGDMIYEINGHKLDNHGEMNADWSPEEKISIIDYVSRLMIGEDISIVFYRNGERKEAKIKFDHTKLAPIHQKYPAYESIDYEIVGGFVIMPLTLNHVILLAKLVPELAQYADLKKRMEPALLVTHVMINSQAARVRSIQPGSLITEVNGRKVKSIEDVRQALYKSLDNNFLTLKTTDNIFAVMPFNEVIKDEPKLSRMCFYKPSSTIKDLMKKLEEKNKVNIQK